jgi:hypothetical protein
MQSAHTFLHVTGSYGISDKGIVNSGKFNLDATYFSSLISQHPILSNESIESNGPNKLVQYG